MNGRRHWVLLRGLGRDARHWGAFVELFRSHFEGDRVSTIDTCGNGRFAAMKSPLSISDYTEHCRGQLDDECDGSVHLVALSLGGMVAMDWAERYPDEISSITLINTSAANLSSMFKRLRLGTLLRMLPTLLFYRDSRHIESAILRATSNQPVAPQTLDAWSRYRDECPTSPANLLRQLWAAARFRLGNINGDKVLVLVSENDRIVSACAGTAIASHLDCEIRLHPTAGHDLPLDDGPWIVRQIRLSSIGH